MYSPLTVEQAMAHIAQLCPPLPPEEVDAAQGVGRPLFTDGVARRELPPFDCAGVDGYALRAADLNRANHKRPAFLQVVDMVQVGQTASIPVGPGQAARLERGAPLPDGCDCVVPLEDTDEGTETVAVLCQLWPFDNIQREGSLAQRGQVLCPAGQAPDCALTVLLRAAGVPTLSLRPLARLGVLTVGNHLAPARTAVLPPAQVPDVSRLYLSECWRDQVDGVLERWSVNRESDIMEGCKALLGSGVALLLTVGAQAPVQSALVQLGAQPEFCGLELRGHKATALFRYRQTLILSLPDDPYSAAVGAHLLVPPALAALGENPDLLPRRKTVLLENGVSQSRPQRRFLPARFTREGRLLLLEPEGESPAALCGMNALADLPPRSRPQAGERVTALLLP